MIKSITLLIFLLLITTVGWSQEFSILNTSPGENTQTQENNWEPIELQYKVDWREKSVGLLLMPIPLDFSNIIFVYPSGSAFAPFGEKLFSVGVGVSLNYDFNATGSGLGNITNFALIFGNGDSSFQAYDLFTALKYDIKLGTLSKFELSPLAGLGILTFTDTNTKLNFGSSLYFSGGIRVTWLAAPRLFVGVDIQSVPLIFNTKKLLGVDGVEIFTGDNFEAASDVQIEYTLPVQVNLSLRYNIF
ncbi:MAG: hypothetical protein ACI83B_001311 [Sediminicola sp.]|jgi:hypothetical protein|tara:strand:+ start:4445 stop:5182 length:738 start_codon:yes stop_codon:yes gene_type:complete